MKKVSRENLDALFAAIAEAKKLYLPVADSTDEKRSAKYTVWTPKTKYASEAVNTVRSAKDFFFPQVENMVNFKVNGKKIEVDDIRTECEDFVIFGVRACDAASFKILDSVYLSEPVDTFYQNRREHGVVMTMSCTKPSETCFCSVFGIDAAEPAGDVSCWMTDDAVLMQANTEKGEALLASLPMLEDAADDAAEESKAKTKAILEKLPLKNLSTDSFGGDKLMELFNSDKWAGLSEACLGCGTCTFVCPSAWSIVSASPHRIFLRRTNRTASRHCSFAWALALAVYSLFQMSNRRWRHSSALSFKISTPYRLVIASTEYRS